MSKYLLHPDHINSTIISKSPDGHDILVTKNTFNDYFAECMLRSGQGHCIMINRHHTDETSEKKSFTQISETSILLTLQVEEIGKNEPSLIVKEPELKPNDGMPKLKRAYKKRGS